MGKLLLCTSRELNIPWISSYSMYWTVVLCLLFLLFASYRVGCNPIFRGEGPSKAATAKRLREAQKRYKTAKVKWIYLLHVTYYKMLHNGTTCYMLLHVTWYYMLHGTKCYMVVHVTWYYMLHGFKCYMVLNVTWYNMLLGNNCYMVLNVTCTIC